MGRKGYCSLLEKGELIPCPGDLVPCKGWGEGEQGQVFPRNPSLVYWDFLAKESSSSWEGDIWIQALGEGPCHALGDALHSRPCAPPTLKVQASKPGHETPISKPKVFR